MFITKQLSISGENKTILTILVCFKFTANNLQQTINTDNHTATYKSIFSISLIQQFPIFSPEKSSLQLNHTSQTKSCYQTQVILLFLPPNLYLLMLYSFLFCSHNKYFCSYYYLYAESHPFPLNKLFPVILPIFNVSAASSYSIAVFCGYASLL